MGYPAIAKSLANTAVDFVPGGRGIKNVVSGVAHVLGLGGGPPDRKSLDRARKAGHAALAGDPVALQYLKDASTGSQYGSTRARAQSYLDLLALKAPGSRSDGMQWVKAKSPIVAGGGPMSGALGRQQLPELGHVAFTPDGTYVAYDPANPRGYARPKRRRKKKSTARKSRSTRRSKARTRRKSRSTRKLKFGSAAYRKKYLGHK